MADGVRADISIANADVVVHPHGVAQLWAMRSKVRVPLRSITSVELIGEPSNAPRKMRALGTWIPGYVAAGVFGFRKPRSFWVVGTSRPLVVINTKGSGYAQVVFSADDPAGTKAMIERAIEQHR